MDTFDFPNFTWTVKYPESSGSVKFGRGWQFASKPKGPDQVTYLLKFEAMQFFTDAAGNVITTGAGRAWNMARLENFYNDKKLYEKFILPLPGKGNITVRFAKPLEYTLLKNGGGLTEPFTLEVLSQP
jgi:hypothetical protein